MWVIDMEGVLEELAEGIAENFESKREVENYAVNAKAKSEWGYLNKNFRAFWQKGKVEDTCSYNG